MACTTCRFSCTPTGAPDGGGAMLETDVEVTQGVFSAEVDGLFEHTVPPVFLALAVRNRLDPAFDVLPRVMIAAVPYAQRAATADAVDWMNVQNVPSLSPGALGRWGLRGTPGVPGPPGTAGAMGPQGLAGPMGAMRTRGPAGATHTHQAKPLVMALWPAVRVDRCWDAFSADSSDTPPRGSAGPSGAPSPDAGHRKHARQVQRVFLDSLRRFGQAGVCKG